MTVREGIEEKAPSYGFDVTRIFHNDLDEIPQDIDGIIAIGKFSSAQVTTLARINSKLVFIDDDHFGSGYDSVLTDFQYGIENVLDYFDQQNIADIGLIYGEEKTTDNLRTIPDPRYRSFKNNL